MVIFQLCYNSSSVYSCQGYSSIYLVGGLV